MKSDIHQMEDASAGKPLQYGPLESGGTVEQARTYLYENLVDAFCARGLLQSAPGRFDDCGSSPTRHPEPVAEERVSVEGSAFVAHYDDAMIAYDLARKRWDQLAEARDSGDMAAREYQANLPARYEDLVALYEQVRDFLVGHREEAAILG